MDEQQKSLEEAIEKSYKDLMISNRLPMNHPHREEIRIEYFTFQEKHHRIFGKYYTPKGETE